MKGIDFKAAALKAAGHAAGAAGYTQLNKLAFMKKLGADPAKAGTKGLLTAAIGYLAIPLIASKLKVAGKGAKGAFIEHVGEGIGIIGIMQTANAFIKPKNGAPALFPAISGYEELPYNNSGMGMITEDTMGDVGDLGDLGDVGEVGGYEEGPLMNSSLRSVDANSY